MNGFLSTLYILGLYCAFMAGSIWLRNQSPKSAAGNSNFPKATLFLLLAIGIPSILQFFSPTLLSTFQRDYERFLSGDWWRLISPLFFQDGGVSGTVSNLIGLALMGFAAERMWNGRSMLIVFFLGGIIGEVAGFAWQPIGAGNSVGNFSLAAGIAVTVLLRHSPRPVQVLALLALLADVILLGLRDIHGAAAIAGAMQALILVRVWSETARN